ncbi:hypothetical protein OEZ77_26760, partial [Leclercia adecarboxylata]|uniref:hypothetical protein n=1 Tax=Leclercia adecarboxylata TaxID=83655 RepID=UPI00234D1310
VIHEIEDFRRFAHAAASSMIVSDHFQQPCDSLCRTQVGMEVWNSYSAMRSSLAFSLARTALSIAMPFTNE